MIFTASKVGEVSPVMTPFSIHENISPLFLSIALEFPSTSKAQSLNLKLCGTQCNRKQLQDVFFILHHN